MNLKNCQKNTLLRVISINLDDLKLKLRLYEIGFFPSSIIQILKYSSLKNTMLVQVLDSCFAIKANIASGIEVEYA